MGFNYSDFTSGAISGFKFARKGCDRNEYRQGILNAAQARLFEQDLNKDGVLTLDEYISANEYSLQKQAAMYGTNTGEADGSYEDFVLTQQAKMQIQAEDFRALDINGDGVLDQRELANEINLMDRYDGKEDGTVSQKGFEKLWGSNDSARRIGRRLRNNYNNFNAKNLGMPWDKYGSDYSEACGEIFNPYNLNSNPYIYNRTPFLYNNYFYTPQINVNSLMQNIYNQFFNINGLFGVNSYEY